MWLLALVIIGMAAIVIPFAQFLALYAHDPEEAKQAFWGSGFLKL